MSENIPPLPDLMKMRKESSGENSASQPETTQLTLEEAFEMFPDLKQMLEEGKGLFLGMVEESKAMSSAAEKELLIPGAQQKMFRLQMGFARKIDEIFNALQTEKDAIRVEILRAIYSDMVPHWQSMVLQLHMSRVMVKHPARVHETLLGEATALLQRATG